MTTAYRPQLAAVKAYFDNGDTHLGYRRLLDAAIETQDPAIYSAALSFCSWYDAHTGGDSTAAGVQVNKLLEQIDKVPVPAAAAGVRLEAHGISKKYSHGSFALQPMNIALRSRSITGLVGENGNGKTTLLRLLYGELKPDTGSVNYHLSGMQQQRSFYNVKTRLAFIPQRPNAWYGPLMDNLRFTAAHYGFRGQDNYLWTEIIAARLGLRPFRNSTWNRISSGYKMRFELARTLIKKPELLLLDEPLANLDMLAQQVILEDLKYLAASQSMPMSIILSSQQLYEVEKVSEQVIFLQGGKAQMLGTVPGQDAARTVLELETSAGRDALQQIFAADGLEKISFNGGIYILYFAAGTHMNSLLKRIGDTGIPVKYLRDISASTRRFFDA